jgi:hypothetical protein
LRFTPLVALRDAEALFLDLTASTRLLGSGPPRLRLAALARRFGFEAQVAFAGDAPTALALATWGGGRANAALAALPIEALTAFWSPFTSLAHDPARQRHAAWVFEKLRQLGIHRLGDLLSPPPRSGKQNPPGAATDSAESPVRARPWVPTPAIARRLGPEALRAVQRLRESAQAPARQRASSRQEPWPIFHPPEKIREEIRLATLDSSAPCLELEPLLFALKPALDRVLARLRARCLRLSAFRLELALEAQAGLRATPPRHWLLRLPGPQGSTPGVLPIVRDRLAHSFQIEPLAAAVEAIAIEVEETAPGQGAQASFFNQRWEDNEAWDALLARLLDKLGPGSVFCARPRESRKPETAWEAVPPSLPEKSEHEPETQDEPRAGNQAKPRKQKEGKPEGKPKDAKKELKLASENPGFGWPTSVFFQPSSERPLRLLSTPLPLLLREGFLLPLCNTLAPRLRPKSARGWRATHWQGPERLSPEWWLDPQELSPSPEPRAPRLPSDTSPGTPSPISTQRPRDYFAVETEAGARLWVFRPSGTQDGDQFYLHGFFD